MAVLNDWTTISNVEMSIKMCKADYILFYSIVGLQHIFIKRAD